MILRVRKRPTLGQKLPRVIPNVYENFRLVSKDKIQVHFSNHTKRAQVYFVFKTVPSLHSHNGLFS
jgi:hypothetical protein